MVRQLLLRLIPDGELLLDTVGQYSLTKSGSTYMANVGNHTKSFDSLHKAYWHLISVLEPMRCTDTQAGGTHWIQTRGYYYRNPIKELPPTVS